MKDYLAMYIISALFFLCAGNENYAGGARTIFLLIGLGWAVLGMFSGMGG